MKNVFLVVAGLLTGFLVSSYYYKQRETHLPPPVAKVKFQDFMDHEMKTFAAAQSAEEKLKAAEEMYGKMMVLFLAELGLKSASVEPTAITATTPSTSEGEGEQTTEDNIQVPAVDGPPVAALPSTEPAPVKEAQEVPAPPALGSKNHYESMGYLNTLKSGVYKFNGQFEGSLTRKIGDNKGRIDRVVMTFNLHDEDGKLQGDTLVSLIDPSGVEYSRNSGVGGNKSIKGTLKKNFFYVEASPTSYFLFDLSEYPKIIGEYYDNGQDVGTVTLRKSL